MPKNLTHTLRCLGRIPISKGPQQWREVPTFDGFVRAGRFPDGSVFAAVRRPGLVDHPIHGTMTGIQGEEPTPLKGCVDLYATLSSGDEEIVISREVTVF
jgi:hypothetical protein